MASHYILKLTPTKIGFIASEDITEGGLLFWSHVQTCGTVDGLQSHTPVYLRMKTKEFRKVAHSCCQSRHTKVEYLEMGEGEAVLKFTMEMENKSKSLCKQSLPVDTVDGAQWLEPSLSIHNAILLPPLQKLKSVWDKFKSLLGAEYLELESNLNGELKLSASGEYFILF